MLLYFMLHDAPRFHRQLRPALSAAWRERSFEPCRAFCADLAPIVHSLHEQYRLGQEEPLLLRAANGLPFDRGTWRLLVGEALFYAADEFPEIQTAPETLFWLLAPEHRAEMPPPRERFAPIHQVHWGARDLVLGGFYRPDAAGYNDVPDVVRLASYLTACPPTEWTTAHLRERNPVAEEADLQDELEFARQCLRTLQELYARAAEKGQIVVCELI